MTETASDPQGQPVGRYGSPPPQTAAPDAAGKAPRGARMRALTGLLLLAAMGGGAWVFGYWEPRLLPVRVIEVEGELHHHSSTLLKKTIGDRLSGGILTADLEELKEAAEALPWVGHATLRRVWPDRLSVRVEEHKPVARWGREGLVTAEGLVFHPRTGTVPAGLPVLDGDEKRAPELVSRYLKWRDDLMLAGQLIDAVEVDARGSWRVDLVSGTRLELGTGPVEQRLARFIAASPQLDAAGRAEVIDLRYRNGFAVRWGHGPASTTEGQADSATRDERKPATAVTGAEAKGKTPKTASLGAKPAKKERRTARSTKRAGGAPSDGAAANGKPSRGATRANSGADSKVSKATAATKPGTSAKSTSAPQPGASRPSRGAPVEERPMNAHKPMDRRLQAQNDRNPTDPNL